MMSKKHKFIFVHIPKTGGNSVQNILRYYADDVVKVYGRTLEEIEDLLSTRNGVRILGPLRTRGNNNYVRHSVTVTDITLLEDLGVLNERLGTKKHSTVRDYYENWDKEYYGDIEGYYKFSIIRNPWERMISYYWSPCFSLEIWDKNIFRDMLTSQNGDFDYLKFNGALAVDYLIRFENIQEDFDKVCETIGIVKQQLPVTNKSSRKHYRDYYDDELRELVEQKFREEIEYFKYSF